MDERTHVHFLKISGSVASNKRREFEQTVRFVFNQLPSSCSVRSLATEVQKEDQYYFYSEWKNEPAMKKFMESEEYQLISGAYVALGVLGTTVYGSGSEITTLYPKDADN